MTIASTRQSVASNIDVKRRDITRRITQLAIASAKVPSQSASTSSATTTAPAKQEFRRPVEVPLRSSKMTKVTNLQCQYCDKCFVKSQGMTTHLLEKCDKIPASARRKLLQKAESSNSTTSKQLSKQTMRQDTDSISKYSRFFVNMSKEGASGMQGDDVEKRLQILQTELRKIKNSHTGIIRTPSKSIQCHICKKLFLDCVEYADHTSNHP